ncbi:MAG: hypothetical protein LBV73_24440 [Paraburkholderia sp.]|nr:hypothetical protein [Paraburkholderia sp.]
MIRERPGATSAQIAEHLGIADAGKITTDMWQSIRSGRVFTERIVQSGRHVNAYYLPDQINGDSVTRINQRVVDAKDAIAPALGAGVQASVFGTPVPKARKARARRKPAVRRAPHAEKKAGAEAGGQMAESGAFEGFACALASDGRLLLIRDGRIQLSLTDVEVTTLQNFLFGRKLANVVAGMA